MIRQLQARGLLVSSVHTKTEAAPRELLLTRVAFLSGRDTSKTTEAHRPAFREQPLPPGRGGTRGADAHSGRYPVPPKPPDGSRLAQN